MTIRKGAKIDSAPTSTLILRAKFSDFETQTTENKTEPNKVSREIPKPTRIPKTVGYGELRDKGITEVPKLIAPFMDKVGLAVFYGDSDAAKSSFVKHLAIAIASGDETFLGFEVRAMNKKVLYIPTEDFEDSIAAGATRNGKNYTTEQLNRIQVLSDRTFLKEDLEYLLTQEQRDLVIIDTLGDIFEGDLNSFTETRIFLDEYQQIAEKHRCMIIFMHHTKKGAEELEPHKSNIMGSRGIESKCRLAIELRTDTKNTSIKHLCITKGNVLSKDLKTESFALHFDESTLRFSYHGIRTPFKNLAKSGESLPETEDPIKENYYKLLDMNNRKAPKWEIREELGFKTDSEAKKLISIGIKNNW